MAGKGYLEIHLHGYLRTFRFSQATPQTCYWLLKGKRTCRAADLLTHPSLGRVLEVTSQSRPDPFSQARPSPWLLGDVTANCHRHPVSGTLPLAERDLSGQRVTLAPGQAVGQESNSPTPARGGTSSVLQSTRQSSRWSWITAQAPLPGSDLRLPPPAPSLPFSQRHFQRHPP